MNSLEQTSTLTPPKAPAPYEISGKPFAEIMLSDASEPALVPVNFFVKRSLDLVLASIALAILTVPMAVIGIIIWVESGGSIFYRQRRVGMNGREFWCIKFRTMLRGPVDRSLKRILLRRFYDNGSTDDHLVEPQVTQVGRYMRQWGLDELPQFFNVLLGQMSFVGPRPWIIDEVAALSKSQMERLRVLPGITGLAQIHGRKNLDTEAKTAWDVHYVRNWSLGLDIKILLKTIPLAIRGIGGY